MTTPFAAAQADAAAAHRRLGTYAGFVGAIRQLANHHAYANLDGDQLREALRAELTRLDEAMAS